MADEQETIVEAPAVEAEAPPVEMPVDEPEKVEDKLPASDDGEIEEELPEEEAEEELEEFEWNGKPVKAPKGLKDGVLMHKDYTQKTQEVAARRRELDQAAVRLQEQTKLAEETIEQRAELVAVQKQIQQYQNVNWQAFADTNPTDEVQKHWMAFQQLQDTARRLEGELQQGMSKRTEEAQRAAQEATAKRLQETQEYAQKNIKGWTPQLDKQVIEFALEEGIQMDDLKAAMNPTIYKILHRAMLGHQLLTKQAAKPATQAVKPTQTVSTRGNPKTFRRVEDIDDMEQYAAARAKQEEARRKR